MTRLAKHGLTVAPNVPTPTQRRIRSRGIPTALLEHEVLASDDPAQMSALLRRMLGPNHLVVHPPTDGFHGTVNAIRLRDVTMAYVDVQAAVTLDIPLTNDLYSIHMPLNGSADCSYNGVRLEANRFDALVVNPGTDLQMTMQIDSPQ